MRWKKLSKPRDSGRRKALPVPWAFQAFNLAAESATLENRPRSFNRELQILRGTALKWQNREVCFEEEKPLWQILVV